MSVIESIEEIADIEISRKHVLYSLLGIYGLLLTVCTMNSDLFWVAFYSMTPIVVLVLLYMNIPTGLQMVLWKEVRETRWAWLLSMMGIFLTILIIGITISTISNMDAGPLVMVFGCYILLYGWYVGARSFANERQRGTYDYLASRAVHPRWILLVKYFTGLFQIFSLILLLILTIPFILDINYPVNYQTIVIQIVTAPPFITVLLIFIASYSICFATSILVSDTIRSILIGFPFMLMIGYGWYYSQKGTDSIILGDGILSIMKAGFILGILLSFILGVIGILYYSMYRRRLVWKTGFVFFILLSVWLYGYTQRIFYGDMKPINETQDIQFDGGYYYHDNKIYGFAYLPKVESNQLVVMDVSNPHILKSKIVLTLPKGNWLPTFDFDNNRLYTIESTWTGFKGDSIVYITDTGEIPSNKSEQSHWSVPQQPYSAKESQLVVWDIRNLDKPIVMNRIHFLTETAKAPFSQSVPLINQSSTQIILNYSIETGQNYNVRGNIFYPYGYLWKRHRIEIDKKTLKVMNDYDVNSPTIGAKEYSVSDKTDRSKLNYKWDWLDRLNQREPQRDYFPENIVTLKKNLSMIAYRRGYVLVDVSDSAHPKQVGKITNDKFDGWVNDNNYLYVFGQVHGLAIYKLPKVGI